MPLVATRNFGLSTQLASIAAYAPIEVSFLHRFVDTQLTGALRSIGTGVLDDPDDNSFKVSAGTTSASWTLAPGTAIVSEEIGSYVRSVWLCLPIQATFTPDDDTEWELGLEGFIHIFVKRISQAQEGQGNLDSRTTGLPDVSIGLVEDVDGGLLLARIAPDGTIEDRRAFTDSAALKKRVAQLEEDAGYTETDRAIGTISERLSLLEGGSTGGGGGGGEDTGTPSPAYWTQLYSPGVPSSAREVVENRFAAIEAVLAAQKSGVDPFPAPFDLLADQIAILTAGLAEVNPPSVERGQISAIGANFGIGQNSTPNYSPDTNDPLELPFDEEEGLFTP
jgi:hypothetical protein